MRQLDILLHAFLEAIADTEEWAESHFATYGAQQMAFIAAEYDILKTDCDPLNLAEYLSHARPALAIFRAHIPTFPLPRSRRGGLPWLPRDTPWPVGKHGKPLNFLMQIDLSENEDGPPTLPRSGTLLFFADAENRSEFGGGAVIHDPESSGLERPAPADLPEVRGDVYSQSMFEKNEPLKTAIFPLVGMRLRSITTLPFPAAHESGAVYNPAFAARFRAFHQSLREASPDPGSMGTCFYEPPIPATIDLWRLVHFVSARLALAYDDKELGAEFAIWAERAAQQNPYGKLSPDDLADFAIPLSQAAKLDILETRKDYHRVFHLRDASVAASNAAYLEAESNPAMAEALASQRSEPSPDIQRIASQYSQMMGHSWAPGSDAGEGPDDELLLQIIPDWAFGIKHEYRFTIAKRDLADTNFSAAKVTRHPAYMGPLLI
ncbi:DUF1963 domain-containing protein [Aurantiacibacter marinus]|nr:DUF1963 domain-containing protein [Aurantiacibacter marinus]